MAPVIVAHDLRKRYAGFAPVLRGVNIEVEAGELVAIMGPSGCGKSTMLHVLGLLHAPDSGTLEILGRDMLGLNREQTAAFRRENLGFIMQASNLFEHSTVFENVEFPLIYEKVSPSERWPRVIRALELVRLSSRVHYPSNRLSGGEQQRVAIARAMVNNPRVLMADEPTGALDQRTSRLIMENFRTLCHAGGVAMIMVTHDAKMAEYCDTIYTLEEGLLVCHKHEPPAIAPGSTTTHLLDGPETRLATALVADNFLAPGGEAFRAEAHCLHREGLLTQVVTLAGSGFLGKDMQHYSLPMAVRHMGGIHSLATLGAFFGLLGVYGSPSPDFSRQVARLAPLAGGILQRRWLMSKARVLASWARTNGVRCLYAAGGTRSLVVAWAASRLAGLPFAFGARSTDGWQLDSGKNSSRPSMDAFAALAADAAFVRCESESLRDALRAHMDAKIAPRIVFIPDPLTLVPMDEEVTAAQQYEKRHCVHMLCVGSMLERKNYGLVLLAAARLAIAGFDFQVIFAGGGPELSRLKSQAKKLNLGEKVVFHGNVPHENMASLYLDADIFVAPGMEKPGVPGDGIPSALAEAMAFFVPPVVSDLPGQKWLVRQSTDGMVVPQNDAEALAGALEVLLRDESLRKSLGAAAHERVRRLQEDVPGRLAALFEPLVPVGKQG